jgi:hypothetical protein
MIGYVHNHDTGGEIVKRFAGNLEDQHKVNDDGLYLAIYALNMICGRLASSS